MHIIGNVMLKIWRNILISLDIRNSVFLYILYFARFNEYPNFIMV